MAGLDGIPSAMLKLASSVIDLSVCSIINSSIASGSYPSVWKRALVNRSSAQRWSLLCPHQLQSNYAPPSGQQNYEGVVRDQVYSHLQSHDLLSTCQSGVCPGNSTSTTLLHTCHQHVVHSSRPRPGSRSSFHGCCQDI